MRVLRIYAATAWIAAGLVVPGLASGSGESLVSVPTERVGTAQFGGNMAIDDALFRKVPLNTREPNPCSPKDLGPKWRGIVIQAPKRVLLGSGENTGQAFATVPICGLYTLDLVNLMNGSPMRLIAIDRATRKMYTGAVVDADPSPDAPPPDDGEPVDPAALKGLATSSYFNPDLVNYVGLPARSAVYDVMVEYGGVQSNKVTIEIVQGP